MLHRDTALQSPWSSMMTTAGTRQLAVNLVSAWTYHTPTFMHAYKVMNGEAHMNKHTCKNTTIYIYIHTYIHTHTQICTHTGKDFTDDSVDILLRQQQAGRQQEIYLHSLLSPGRWMRPMYTLFTTSRMGARKQQWQTDQHQLTERHIYLGASGETSGQEGVKGKEDDLAPETPSLVLFLSFFWLEIFSSSFSGMDCYSLGRWCCGSREVFSWQWALSRQLALETRRGKRNRTSDDGGVKILPQHILQHT